MLTNNKEKSFAGLLWRQKNRLLLRTTMKKQIAILGSTGSIGTQALQVIAEHSDLYEVYALTANNRVELLIEQASSLCPRL
jgi:1-deoxy-D-xylulose 5-phosphate reductoisomerase (EC 1.1.1.267)